MSFELPVRHLPDMVRQSSLAAWKIAARELVEIARTNAFNELSGPVPG